VPFGVLSIALAVDTAAMVDQPRPPQQRKIDVLAKLGQVGLDGWVASGNADRAHLVPLAIAWTGELVIIAVSGTSPTARNITTSGKARIGLGPTRDVVMIDVVLDSAVAVREAPASVADQLAAQADWDARTADGYRYLLLRPVRVQAWREENEIAGRTVMRAGSWVV
jgi:hypothetical protein